MIPPGVRITDADWVLLMDACRDGDRFCAQALLVAGYDMSVGEAEAWVVAVVSAKAWNL